MFILQQNVDGTWNRGHQGLQWQTHEGRREMVSGSLRPWDSRLSIAQHPGDQPVPSCERTKGYNVEAMAVRLRESLADVTLQGQKGASSNATKGLCPASR